MKTFKVICRLIKLIKPLLKEMLVAVIAGVLGFMAVTTIAILGTQLFIDQRLGFQKVVFIMIILGVMKGIFKYLEQWFNHYIAFKVLAYIRDVILKSLRRLAPAKLAGKDKGDLIANITSDVEILEAFYAHTISPVMIAFLYSTIMVAYVSFSNMYVGMILFIAYLIIGVVFPILNYKCNEKIGIKIKQEEAVLKNITLESFSGLKDIKQFQIGDQKVTAMTQQNNRLEILKKQERRRVGFLQGLMVIVELVTTLIVVFLLINQQVQFEVALVLVVAIVTSFKPVINVANVAGILVHSFASGKRILALIDETPIVEDIINGNDEIFHEIKIKDVAFQYHKLDVLKDINLEIKKHELVGVAGESGSGKSTLLKLIMRFYDPSKGTIQMNNTLLNQMNTTSLRNNQSFVTQETYLFKTTIKENIRIANLNASDEEITEACKKAAIHDTILEFQNGYLSIISDDFNVSSGERQRIGLARAFLNNAEMILLDEPTANLDALNEGIILESIKNSKKTIILVSHRKNTLNICNKIINIKNPNEI